MTRRSNRLVAITATAGVLVGVVSAPLSASAQVTVYDPTNYAQNLLTAAHTLQQVNQQITALQNQAQMLINQGKNLASLPYSALSMLQADITRTQSLLAQVQTITFNANAINDAFGAQYGATPLSTSNAALVARAQARWQTTVNALQDTLRIQAGVVGNITTTNTQMSALVTASQSATGALQAAQSGNQLLALITKELADLIGLMAAQSRAQALGAADPASAHADAQARISQFLTPGTYTPTSVSLFH